MDATIEATVKTWQDNVKEPDLAAELAELRSKSDEKAKEDALELASDTENRKAAMRARADARMDKAAALIVERVVNG